MTTPAGLPAPQITVLVPALRGFGTVAPAVAAWQAQTRRDALEIVVLCPDGASAAAEAAEAEVELFDSTGLALHEARARAIEAARGIYVVLGEDHCLPDTDAVERVLEVIPEEPDVVVPALRPADPRTACAAAAFVIGYAQWLDPIPPGPISVFPGHNSFIRRSLLLAQGRERLADDLRGAAFLTRALAADGAQGVAAPAARMRHFDRTSWRFQVRVFVCVGIGFGALRTQSWPRAARLLYPLAAPAVAARHYARTVRHLSRLRTPRGTKPALALLAALWGLGEGIGALLGVERSMPALEVTEVKPATFADVARADAAAAEVAR